jgi:hypothetical protein
MVMIDLPLIIASFWSISAFYLVAQRELFPRCWKRSIALMPALMAAGIALTVINTKAFFEALFGVQTAFARTPKYAIGSSAKVKINDTKYKRKSGWLPYAEIAIGGYFAYMVAFALDTYNFFAIPFLLLFAAGYWWAGFQTLYEEWKGKLAWEKARRLAEQAD